MGPVAGFLVHNTSYITRVSRSIRTPLVSADHRADVAVPYGDAERVAGGVHGGDSAGAAGLAAR